MTGKAGLRHQYERACGFYRLTMGIKLQKNTMNLISQNQLMTVISLKLHTRAITSSLKHSLNK